MGAVAYKPDVVTIWEGMRRYFHEEAHLPVEVVLFQNYEAQVMALLAQPSEFFPVTSKRRPPTRTRPARFGSRNMESSLRF